MPSCFFMSWVVEIHLQADSFGREDLQACGRDEEWKWVLFMCSDNVA